MLNIYRYSNLYICDGHFNLPLRMLQKILIDLIKLNIAIYQ